MLHADNEQIRKLLLKGNFGLEKESLRVCEDGFFSHTAHPFPNDNNIVRDFCENQTEINTPVLSTAKEALECLDTYNRKIQKKLSELPIREYLWPFSNPPYIRNEEDIPIAQFYGSDASKTKYREYLSDRYGRYKMTFSGIHVNYSFDDELLKEDFKLSGQTDFVEYKNKLYVELAKKAIIYGWILVSVTAASPLMDGSFVEKKMYDIDNFNGMASTRCSELGYWNCFAPTFDYTDIRSYADSIKQYETDGWISYASELYYPIRLKPAGENNIDNLKSNGVSHIELRMFDLNPLVQEGLELKDVIFAQLFLVWLASIDTPEVTTKDQIHAVQNFKNAAHYDLKTVKIVLPNEEVNPAADAALNILSLMKDFYKDFSDEIKEVLKFQEDKFINHENRYAWKIRQKYSNGFVKKGMQLAKERQKNALEQLNERMKNQKEYEEETENNSAECSTKQQITA